MLPDWVSNPGPLTYQSGALPTALRSPAYDIRALDKREYRIRRIYRTCSNKHTPRCFSEA